MFKIALLRYSCAIIALLLLSCSVKAEDTSDSAIKEAITILEARQAQIKGKAEKDKISTAINSLKQLSPEKAADAEQVKIDLTPELLRSKLAGKAAYNSKTGELTLIYDFKNKDQLKDFFGDELELKKGIVRIAAGERMKHTVSFASGNVSGTFVRENTEGGHVIMAFNRGFFGYDVNAEPGQQGVFNIHSATQRVGELKLPFPHNSPTQLAFSVNEKRARVTIGKKELGAGRRDREPAGHFVFLGGSSGMKVSSLVISGIPDEDWVQEFFVGEQKE